MVQDKEDQRTEQVVENAEEITSPPEGQTNKNIGLEEEETTQKDQQQQ